MPLTAEQAVLYLVAAAYLCPQEHHQVEQKEYY